MEDNEDLTINNPATSETTPLFGEKHKEYLLSSTEKSDKTRKRLTFAAFALLYFCMSASYSVIAPFFPNEAKEKGANGNVVGFIFGIFALVTFIASPIAGVLVPVVGVRFLLFSGVFLIGGAEFLFGFLNRMPDGPVFITFAFLIRSVDGVGGAAAMTAAVAFLAQCFPDNVGSVMGGLELFTGIGLTLGPLIGGGLYEVDGFGLPFFVLAGLMLVMLPIIACILPNVPEARQPNEGTAGNATIAKLLKIPAFDVIVSTIVVGGMAIGIVEPTLAPHLKDQFNLTDAAKVGLLFLLLSGAYAVFAPLFGWVADKTSPRWVMTLGCFSCGIGFLLLGPAPLSFLPKKLWLVEVSLGIIGLSLGPCFVPAMAEMENIVKRKGYPDDLATHGIVSGIFGAAFNIGAFLGPTLSGVITEHVHFPWTCTGFGILFIIQSMFLLALACSSCSTNTSERRDSENPSERRPSTSSYNNIRSIQSSQTC